MIDHVGFLQNLTTHLEHYHVRVSSIRNEVAICLEKTFLKVDASLNLMAHRYACDPIHSNNYLESYG